MAIKKANELDFSNKKIAMLLLARPGSGKTTLASSAPRPLLIDLENGVDRVEACYRCDVSTCEEDVPLEKRYEVFLNDLKNEDLSNYDTIIVDTLGKLIELLTPVVIKENSVNGLKDGKTLSLKGYGAVSSKVKEFINFIKSLNKHIIFISHVTEVNDGEVVKTRVNIPGSTKDSIWNDIDLGGFLEMNGKKRIVSFTPTERYDAKGTHGIKGTYEIPTLKDTQNGGTFADNKFLTNLFDVYIKDIQQSQKQYSEDEKIYNEAMKMVSEIEKIDNIDDLNIVVDKLKDIPHALTSKKELMFHINAVVERLGATYDKEAKRYIISA